jgi:hypothetical protein
MIYFLPEMEWYFFISRTFSSIAFLINVFVCF